MRIPLLGKILGLAGLALVTVVATSTFAQRARRPLPPGMPSVRTITTARVVRSGTPAAGPSSARASQGKTRTSTASGAMQRLRVRTVGATLYVSADACIRDVRSGMRCLWSVRVYTSGDLVHPVFVKFYDNRLFPLVADKEANPTFEDELALPLPPGDYVAEVAVFRLLPGMDASVLGEAAWASRLRGPWGRARISLGN